MASTTPRKPGRDDDDQSTVDPRTGAAPDLLDVADVDDALERSSDDLTGHGRSDAYDDEAAENR